MKFTRRLLIILLLVLISSCGKKAPPAPAARSFGDSKEWVTLEDMVYSIGSTNITITVPAGFVTDFASIPPQLALIGLSAHGQYSRAAIVHDYLYWAQACTRAQADRLMVIAMKESRVGTFDESAIYQGVDVFGQHAWDANRREHELGIPKVIPIELRKPEDSNMNWPDYRRHLFERGIRDPAFEKQPAYCKYGNSREVPSAVQ